MVCTSLKGNLISVLILSLCLFISFASNSQAASDAYDNSAISNDTIEVKGMIVSSNRIPLSSFVIPASASIITLTKIENQTYESLGRLVKDIPGLRSYPAGNIWGTPHIDVRGFYGAGLAQYLNVTFDEIPINNFSSGIVNWNNFDINDISRAETIKGPVSAQYSDFGFGGNLAVTTIPLGTEIKNLSISSGTDKAYSIGGQFSKKTENKNLFFSASKKENDGWREHSKFELERGTFKFENKAHDKTSMKFILSYSHSYEELPGALTESEYTANRNSVANDLIGNPLTNQTESKQLITGLTYKKSINELTNLKTLAYLNYSKNENIVTLTSTLNHLPELMSSGVDFSLNHDGYINGKVFKLSGGAVFEFGSLKTSFTNQLDELITDGEGSRITTAGYISSMYYLSNNVYLSLGARLENINTQFDYNVAETTPVAETKYYDEFSVNPKFAIGANFSENISMFGSVARAYKTPTLVHLYDSAPFFDGMFSFRHISISNSDLEPMDGVNYEFGLKTKDYFESEFSITYYSYLIENEIDFDLAMMSYANISKSHHSGVEIIADKKFSEIISANGSVIFNSSKFDSGDFDGNQINGVPELTYQFGLTYNKLDKYFAKVELYGVDKLYIDQANSYLLDRYNTVSLTAGLEFSNFILTAKINNLLDEEYIFNGYWDPLLDIPNGGARLYPAPKRNILITLGSSF